MGARIEIVISLKAVRQVLQNGVSLPNLSHPSRMRGLKRRKWSSKKGPLNYEKIFFVLFSFHAYQM